MKKSLCFCLAFLSAVCLSVGAVFASAKTIETGSGQTNVAVNLNVNYADYSGNTLYARPFVNAPAQPDANILTVETSSYEYLRFNNAIWLGATDSATSGNKLGWAEIDLGGVYSITGVGTQFWNDWYFTDVVIQLANKSDFSDAFTVFDNDSDNSAGFGIGNGRTYQEVYTELQKFSFSDYQARYVRVTNNAKNSGYSLFSRIEVYGTAVNYQPEKPADVAKVSGNKPSGKYSERFDLTLATVYENGKIYYTTDGTYPTVNSTEYTAPVSTEIPGNSVMIRAVVTVNNVTSFSTDFTYDFAPVYKKGDNVCAGITPNAYDYSGNAITYCGHGGGTSLASATDGTVGTGNSIQLSADGVNGSLGWAVIDFGTVCKINKVFFATWHNHYAADAVIELSESSDFTTGVTVVYCNDTDNSLGLNLSAVSIDSSVDCQNSLYNYAQTTDNGGGITFDFTMANARYIRVTSKDTEKLSTILTEIQAFAASDTVSETSPVRQGAIVKVDCADTFIVPNGVTLSECKDRLPETLDITDDAGNKASLEGSWICSDFPQGSAVDSKDYSFTFVLNNTDKFIDIFGLLTFTVKVETPADTAILSQEITAAEGLDENLYTVTKFNTMKVSLSSAKAVFQKQLKTQTETDEAYNSLKSSVEALEFKGNTDNLKTLVDQVKDYAETDYTTQKFEAFKTALISAEKVIAEGGNVDMNQAQVDAVTDALDNAVKVLVLRATNAEFAALNTLYTARTTELQNEENCTVSSVANVKAALVKAETFIGITDEQKAETAETAVNNIIKTLTDNVFLLKGNTVALKTAYDKHNSELGLSEQDTNGYYIECWVNYLDRMYDAEKVLAEGGTDDKSQTEVDGLLNNLENAVSVLETYADRTNFDALYSEAANIDSSKYTASTFAALKTVLDSETPVYKLTKEYSSQAVIAEAYTALKTVYDALKERGNKTVLNQLVASYSGEDAKEYTSQSYNNFINVLFEAKTCKTDVDADQEKVDNATNELKTAYEALVKLGDKTALKTAIDKAAAIDAGKYTGEKADDLTKAKAYADSVYNSNNVSQSEVDEAEKLLETAAANLTADEKTGCSSEANGILPILSLSLLAFLIIARKKEGKRI